jgi:N-acetylglucosaminyl-diphospho-decaprenol L-rhamnosyltransferase
LTAAKLAVVVVNFESGALLAGCVRSVLADTSAGDVELVVVDNGSGDDSIARLEQAMPETRVVHAPGNVGYARGANLVIAATRAPIVAVCNPDLDVEPGTMGALVAAFDADARLGAAGPRIRNTDGTDYPSARSLPSIVDAVGHGAFGMFFPRNRFTRRYRQLDADPAVPRAVDWVSGAAIWLRRDALDDVGGWDERYFMYMEDIDLCSRLRDAGWGVRYEPAGTVVHVQGASTARRPYRMIVEHHRSAWRFTRRRYTGWRRALLPFSAAYLTLRAVLALGHHAFGAFGASGGTRRSG